MSASSMATMQLSVDKRFKQTSRLARHLTGGMVTAFSAPKDREAPLSLRVVKGRHVGASTAMQDGEFVLGSSLDSDVVLTDAGIAPRHVKVRLGKGRLVSKVIVTALGGDATAGPEVIEKGEEAEVFLPATVTIGDAAIELSGPAVAVRSHVWALPALAGLLCLGALAVWLPSQIGALIPSLPEISLPQLGSSEPAPADRAANVARKIEEAGLKDILTVSPRGDMVVVQGTVPPANHMKWREVRQKLAIEGFDVWQIVDMVRISSTAEAPKGLVAAIVLGKKPFVISSSGRKAHVGETLDDGWVVREVRAEGVTIERGQQLHVLKP